MIKKFQKWVYGFVVEYMLNDSLFIFHLNTELKQHNERLKATAEAAKLAKIDAEQRKRAEEVTLLKKQIQDKCLHLKGGLLRGAHAKDYAIWVHQFTDEHYEVHCMLCNKIWLDIKSAEVQYMLTNTTNTLSESEIRHGNKVYNTDIAHPPTKEQKEAYLAEEDRIAEEMRNNPLWPWASRGYVKYWDKMLKRLRKKKKKVS